MANRKLIAGNWKMNGLAAPGRALADAVAADASTACDVLICPPATLIAALAGGALAVGGQDCHWEASGAHTGDVSAAMLADAGAVAVIVGHSERRQDHGETDEIVARKAAAAQGAGLTAIVCVGETQAEREAGETLERIGAQLAGSLGEGIDPARLVIAYEPVWAIGTGLVPGVGEIADAHAFIRKTLIDRFGVAEGRAVRILYGGSVKAANAEAIFGVDDVDGALVGGASLQAHDFRGVIAAAG